MKRYLSVFEMIIRSSIYRVLVIFLVMIAAESLMLVYAWNQSLAVLQPNLEEWIGQSYIVFAFGIAYALLTRVLSVSGTNTGSMLSYTLQRLRIPERKVYLLQWIYNSFCYLLLWGIQAILLFGISAVYVKCKQGVVMSNQTIVLAFYRNEFMHSILPMEDILGWCALVFFIILMGGFAADFSQKQRNGKQEWMLIAFFIFTCSAFLRDVTDGPIILSVEILIWIMIWIVRKIKPSK